MKGNLTKMQRKCYSFHCVLDLEVPVDNYEGNKMISLNEVSKITP
jgi:hypothetical protein